MSGLERDLSPADQLWQQRSNRLAAQLRLIQLRRAEPLVHRLQELPTREDLSMARIAQIERLIRQSYGEVTQSRPEWHETFRSRLEQVAISGDRTVDSVLAEVRQLFQNAQLDAQVKGEE